MLTILTALVGSSCELQMHGRCMNDVRSGDVHGGMVWCAGWS